jgi:hypothetical protein
MNTEYERREAVFKQCQTANLRLAEIRVRIQPQAHYPKWLFDELTVMQMQLMCATAELRHHRDEVEP